MNILKSVVRVNRIISDCHTVQKMIARRIVSIAFIRYPSAAVINPYLISGKAVCPIYPAVFNPIRELQDPFDRCRRKLFYPCCCILYSEFGYPVVFHFVQRDLDCPIPAFMPVLLCRTKSAIRSGSSRLVRHSALPPLTGSPHPVSHVP